MENYKVLVSSESESKEVQNLLFELGGDFCFGGKLHCNIHLGLVTINKNGLMANIELEGFDYKEITINQLRDMVVLKRNSIDDTTHTGRSGSQYYIGVESYFWDGIKWEQRDFLNLGYLKPIEKEVKMKEFLNPEQGYSLVKCYVGETPIPKSWIEIPEGAEIAVESWFKNDVIFYKDNGECQFDEKWITCNVEDKNGLIHTNLKTFLEWGEGNKIVWQRSEINKDIDKGLSIKEKLKFIEKWLNGEKIQYILGVESDKIQSEKTQWHNFTEGAMQYIKRSDIKFREAPKYVTINGIEFKSVEKLLKYVKNNFDLEYKE
ncbi:MAG: hypothetical protein RR623_00390 [Bacilli bacterium]